MDITGSQLPNFPNFPPHPQSHPIASSSTTPFQPASSSSPGETPRSAKNQRKRSGCLTCRLRKKKCDEGKPTCGSCMRLGLDCMGYETKRPGWMNKKDKVRDITSQIKQTVNENRSAKMREHWRARAASVHGQEDDSESSYSPNNGIDLQEMGDISTGKPLVADISYDPPNHHQPNLAIAGCDFPSAFPFSDTSTRADYSQQFTSSSHQQTPHIASQHHTAHAPVETPGEAFIPSSAVSSPMIDPDILNLLGLMPPSKPTQPQLGEYYPLYPQLPNTLWFPYPSTLETRENPEDMRYFHHYLTVILPLQFRFDNKPISDVVAPLALQNPRVLQALSAIAALHIATKKRPQSLMDGNMIQDSVHLIADDIFARTTIEATIRELKNIPASELGSDDSILAALSANSFNLFDGGESKGWIETAELCRRCLASVLNGVGGLGASFAGSRSQIDISALMERLGHLVSPLMWVDILMSVTENRASKHLPIYRVFLLDQYRRQGNVNKLLQETVMGCDNTTRLALAETIGLSEWKEKGIRSGNLSHRTLVERADAIERLLAERKWREAHLFEPNDPLMVQRMAMSDVFHHSVRVLLATVVDGCFPNVPDIATAVQDTAEALSALDKYDFQGGIDKLLIFPIVIAGCHADRPALQRVFRQRFTRLGDGGATFGNTRSALKLMEEVWRRRGEAVSEQIEINWRKVMYDLYEGGLLLI